VHGWLGYGHWQGPLTRLGWLGPAQPHGPGWAKPEKKYIKIKNFSKLFPKKSVIFRNFLLHFDQYWFVFLYCKDTNTILKYLVFVKKIKNKKIFYFDAYGQVSQK
jgi:hypothetical protein